VSFKSCVYRDEAMSSARLFGIPRHSSTGEVHRWKNLRRRTRTARRVEGGLVVGRVERSFAGWCLMALSDDRIQPPNEPKD
jgi:hypothetical protein